MYKLFFILLFMGNDLIAQTARKITLEDIYRRKVFTTKEIDGLRSMRDGKTYVSIETDPKTQERFVARSNYSDGKVVEKLFSEKELVYQGTSLEMSTDFSRDEKKVLIPHLKEEIHRYSTKAYYYVFDLTTRKVFPISTRKGKQRYATFSPDGAKVAFVRDNNLFITDLETKQEIQVTDDGKVNHIINGASDWVYEEEFSLLKAFYWNKDGTKIAFYKFDESEVREFTLTRYKDLYPTEYTFKYPKAGERNSTVGIYIYDINDKSITKADVGPEKDQYIPRIQWTQNPNTLCILRMNRHQNHLDYLFADANSGSTRVLIDREDPSYIDINDDLIFLKDGQHFIITDDKSGFNHIYLYAINGKLIRQVTQGHWVVTKLYGINENTGTLYYQSTEASPLERDVFSIELSGNNKRRLSPQPGTSNATFSSDFSYYILNHSSVDSPPSYILKNKAGKVERILENNQSVRDAAKEFGIRPREFFQFTTEDKVTLNGYMIKPDNFKHTTEYPVLMYVYGGPGSQEVANEWKHRIWLDMMAQKGYLIVCVDNRGTGFRGSDFQKATYLKLGKYETVDQIAAARWLAKQSFVDEDRIGIWGWSYGGYLSSLAITQGAGIFKAAIAIAPVTNWRYYDTIYTERYLRTPQENQSGYDDHSPINYANKLQGNFLLVHGTADDNVHFQNSVVFSEALIQANKPFEQAYYPNKDHSIAGTTTSIHLFNKLTNFILKNL